MQSELIQYGTAMILNCGKKLLAKRSEESFSIREKGGCSDIVTDHDIWVQDYLMQSILSRYPEHRVLGEEETAVQSSKSPQADDDSPRWIWVIDPIDGTSNYSCLREGYAISVGLMWGSTPVYGWVYDVAADRLYQGNAQTNEKPIAAFLPSESILYMGYKTMQDLQNAKVDVYGLCRRFRGVRYEGCASLELCKVSEEKERAYLNSHLKIWDFIAAAAILSEKGCIVRAAQTGKGNYFVCGYSSEAVYETCRGYIPEEIAGRMEIITKLAGLETTVQNRKAV